MASMPGFASASLDVHSRSDLIRSAVHAVILRHGDFEPASRPVFSPDG